MHVSNVINVTVGLLGSSVINYLPPTFYTWGHVGVGQKYSTSNCKLVRLLKQ